jgi:hypothetical protein
MKAVFYIVIVCFVIASSSCVDHSSGDTEARKKVIDEGVKIKVGEFRDREWARCMEQARQLAVAEVDSMVRLGARNDAIEPVVKPPKPTKPPKPDMQTLPDSLKKKNVEGG